jgi:hypothetical protein
MPVTQGAGRRTPPGPDSTPSMRSYSAWLRTASNTCARPWAGARTQRRAVQAGCARAQAATVLMVLPRTGGRRNTPHTPQIIIITHTHTHTWGSVSTQPDQSAPSALGHASTVMTGPPGSAAHPGGAAPPPALERAGRTARRCPGLPQDSSQPRGGLAAWPKCVLCAAGAACGGPRAHVRGGRRPCADVSQVAAGRCRRLRCLHLQASCT